ncbi:MAG TPA: hypothetical protein VGL66_01155 [Caulobacteraceae bacterium]
MQFRLTYEGQLLGASRENSRAAHKHEIRSKLHPQLKRLWGTSAWLSQLGGYRFPNYAAAVSGHTLKNSNWAKERTYPEVVAANYQSHGRHWLPLVGEDMNLTCGLDILFLRPGSRGNLLNVGDIDGRLKTLFDALAIPTSGAGLPEPEANQPVYVLLSDDRLISNVAVETDELLEPTSVAPERHDARLIITVNVKPMRANWFTLGFSAL